jgi:hypothetical protein
MKLFEVIEAGLLRPADETFTSQREFIAAATDPNNGDKYAGKWKLIGRTESDVLTIVPVVQCKLAVDGE